MSNNALNFVTGQDVFAQEINAIARQSGDLFWCATGTPSNSTTWVAIGGISFDFVKQFDNTSLLVDMSISVSGDTVGAEVEIGFQVGDISSSYIGICGHHNYNELNISNSVGGVGQIGIAAGALTIRPVLHRSAGTGIVTAAIGQPVYITAREVLL